MIFSLVEEVVVLSEDVLLRKSILLLLRKAKNKSRKRFVTKPFFYCSLLKKVF